MYHAHFGLEKGLFGEGIAAETAVFRSPSHERLASQLKLALSSSSSAIVLRGPAGVGKTTFTSSTLRASSTRLALSWLNGTATNASELLELILVELGIAPARASRIERLQLWRQFHAEMRATDSRLFVVAERTEDFSVEVLHALDQLTAPDAAGNVGANLVLLGHADIDAHLAAPLLDSLRQRIRLRAELQPFTEAELQDYLRHQVACARGHYDHVFAPGTVAALHRFSAGVTRLANTLCETALELAASEKHKLLTAELVTRTAVSLLGLPDPTPVARTPSRESPAPPSTATIPAPRPTAAAAPAREVTPSLPQTAATPAALVSAAPVAAPHVGSVLTATAPVAAPPPTAAAEGVTPGAPAPTPTPTLTPRASIATPPPAAPRATAPAHAAAPASVASTATPAPPPAPARAPEPPRSATFEFDGAATDVTDVDIMDFPVLTDAVDPHEPLLIKRTAAPVPSAAAAAAPGPAPVSPPAAAVLRTPPPPRSAAVEPHAAPAKPAAPPRTPPPAVAPAAQKPAAAAPSRIQTAYAMPKPAPATAAAAPKAPPPPPAAPVPSVTDLADDDLLRQTQTMRAIAVAKSIDDISSSMAETLFGDAELDLVAAALASAAVEWPHDNDPKPGSTAPAEPKAAGTAPKADDPFDIFDLGDDAPLELIDDSTLPPAGQPRKTAAR